MKKSLLSFYLIIICSISNYTYGNSTEKDTIINSMEPWLQTSFNCGIKALLTMGVISEEGQSILKEKSFSKWLENITKRLKENFSVEELQTLKAYFSSSEFNKMENEEVYVELGSLCYQLNEEFLEENYSFITLKISNDYFNLIKNNLDKQGYYESFSTLFDKHVKYSPHLIENMSEQQIEDSKKKYIQRGYNLYIAYYSNKFDQNTFKKCAEFELSNVGLKFSEALGESTTIILLYLTTGTSFD